MVKNKFITQPSYKKKIIITGGLGYIGFELWIYRF